MMETFIDCKCTLKTCPDKHQKSQSLLPYKIDKYEPPTVTSDHQALAMSRGGIASKYDTNSNGYMELLRRPRLKTDEDLTMKYILDSDIIKNRTNTKRTESLVTYTEHRDELKDSIDSVKKLFACDSKPAAIPVVSQVWLESSSDSDAKSHESTKSHDDCSELTDSESVIPLRLELYNPLNTSVNSFLGPDIPVPLLKPKHIVFAIPTGLENDEKNNRDKNQTLVEHPVEAKDLIRKRERSFSAGPLPRKKNSFVMPRPKSAYIHKPTVYTVQPRIINFVTDDILKTNKTNKVGHRTLETGSFLENLKKCKVESDSRTVSRNTKVVSNKTLDKLCVRNTKKTAADVELDIVTKLKMTEETCEPCSSVTSNIDTKMLSATDGNNCDTESEILQVTGSNKKNESKKLNHPHVANQHHSRKSKSNGISNKNNPISKSSNLSKNPGAENHHINRINNKTKLLKQPDIFDQKDHKKANTTQCTKNKMLRRTSESAKETTPSKNQSTIKSRPYSSTARLSATKKFEKLDTKTTETSPISSNSNVKSLPKRRKVKNRKPPVTMVSLLKGKVEDNKKSSPLNVSPASSVNHAKTRSLSHRAQSKSLSHRAKSAPINPVCTIDFSRSFLDNSSCRDNTTSPECEKVFSKLQDNNVSISMDTLKRALMKPCERASYANSSKLSESHYHLIQRNQSIHM